MIRFIVCKLRIIEFERKMSDKKLRAYTINKLKKMEKKLLEIEKKNEWITVKEIEEEYSISRKTLDRMREKGLKVSQPSRNGKILVNRKELELFLNQRV